jgi:hypothetical protein
MTLSLTSSTCVLQAGFRGTACENCAAEDVFGPNCSAGESDLCSLKALGGF